MSVPGVGSQLGHYRLEVLLGRGGVGVVYRAEDERLGRKVALKLLAPDVTDDPRFRTRFLSESRLAASIDHAGIIPIYEAGEIDGLLFIAMRYVEGTDLASLLRREGPLAPERALDLVEQLADALDAAHARALVHRDVKPANALVVREGTREHVYLADFGLTRHVTSDGGPTATGAIVGTLDYLAPECIAGGSADGQADQYALGCVLYQCLTGEVPFPRDSEVAAMYAHLEDDPPRPSDRRPGISAALDAAVLGALAKNPDDRWASGTAMIAAARSQAPSSEQTKPGSAVAPRERRRRPSGRAFAGVGAAAAAALAVGAGALMLGGSGAGGDVTVPDGDAVAVIDPGGAALKATIPVGTGPSQIAAGAGALWVTNTDGGTVSRIDPRTRSVNQTIGVGSGPGAVAVGAGAVWVVNTLDGTLSRIAPRVAREVDSINVGNGPSGVCVAAGAVWVAGEYDRAVVRYDPVRRSKTTTRLDDRPTHLACGGGWVWATSESSGTVTQLTTGVRSSVVNRIRVGAGASGAAWGHGALWVANRADGTVSRVDGRTGVPLAIPIGAGSRPANVAVAADGVWVSNEQEGTVVRIDPVRNRVGRPLRLGNVPQGLVVIGGDLWVAVRAIGAARRGGRLRVVHPGARGVAPITLPFLDPTALYHNWESLQLTNIGLLAFASESGRRSAVVVPALAEAVPAPADGGRTYAFRLRRGLRYADGAPIRASDFRHGLERFVARGIGDFYDGIVGADACTRTLCDLARGADADDADGTITFRLTAPDPDFLFKLAVPSAMPVPAGVGRVLREPVPATGPYMIAEFDDRRIRLVRNPRFRPTADRSAGYVDAITIEEQVSPRTAVRDVETGRADVVGGEFGFTPGTVRLLDGVATRHPELLHTSPRPITLFGFLNTRVPPFDNVDARRAVNLAVDREAAVAIKGGPRFARPTCQPLPRGFPGYREYCPHTRAAAPRGAGPWTSPDLARARMLVARSGTRGARVTVVGTPTEATAEARLLAETLSKLGYRVRLRLLPGSVDYYQYVANSDHRVQVGPAGWLADWPTSRGFLYGLFGCAAFTPSVGNQANYSEFCDPETERLMRRAEQLLGGDPRADALWARVDRRITDQAAIVPLANIQGVYLVSRRLLNFKQSQQRGVLYDRVRVR